MVSDAALLEAMRIPASYRMAAWGVALREHNAHPSFQVHQNAYDRTFSFTCECSGSERTWTISISELRSGLPEARQAALRIFSHRLTKGRKKDRKAERIAKHKAKALLFKHLTKAQKWELRATRAFTIIGQDKRTYRITEGTCNNVRLLDEGGRETHSLCVVSANDRLPVYDLMLAQKVLLENDIQAFMQVANKRDLNASPDTFEAVRATITRDDMDEPETWVRAQLEEHGNAIGS